MSIIESIVVAMFCMALVFVVLAILFYLVVAFSFGLNKAVSRKAGMQKVKPEVELVKDMDEEKADHDFSSGELKLIHVDEKTAAMIMAIVSDESHIPLSELCFKSIKAIENPEYK